MTNKKISISFKNTTKDMELYLALMQLEDKSNEIKTILRNILLGGNKNDK